LRKWVGDGRAETAEWVIIECKVRKIQTRASSSGESSCGNIEIVRWEEGGNWGGGFVGNLQDGSGSGLAFGEKMSIHLWPLRHSEQSDNCVMNWAYLGGTQEVGGWTVCRSPSAGAGQTAVGI
jgi:hypothetical protein